MSCSGQVGYIANSTGDGQCAKLTRVPTNAVVIRVLKPCAAWVATTWGHLTGVVTEDDYLLAASAPDLKLATVVLCGIIIAGLGVLNDVTVTQASAVWELV